MQTPEQKKDFIAMLKPGDHIGVRSDTALGKAIRWSTQSNINHTAMFLGNGLLIEAAYQICVMHVNEYINDDKVELYIGEVIGDENITDQDRLDVCNNAVQKYATGIFYGGLGIFGLLFRFVIQYRLWRLAGWFKWSGKNIIAQAHNYWCSESFGIWWALKGVKFTDEDVTWLTPNEIAFSSKIKKLNY
jgi:hypothetical protein